jgi:enamine deaminase RidA (YjgF/YER057c/UK114 family)
VNNQNVADQTDDAGARSMNTGSKSKIVSGDSPRLATAEQRLKQLGLKLPAPPEPFGIYAEAVQADNLLFLTGMLPTIDREAKFTGRIGAELDVQTGRKAAYLATLNALAAARQHWDHSTKLPGSSGSACWWPRWGMSGSSRKSLTALQRCCRTFSAKTKTLARLVYGVASLSLGVPVELELIFEVAQ